MEKKLFGNICFTRLVKALMLSYFLTMLMLLGLSFGLYKFDLSEKTVRIGILAVYIISTFAGGFAMGKMGKTRKFLRGFMLGMLYFLLLLAISAGIYRAFRLPHRGSRRSSSAFHPARSGRSLLKLQAGAENRAFQA